MATVSRKASAYETPSLRTRFQTARSRGPVTQSTYGERCRRPPHPTASSSSQQFSAPSFQPPFSEGNTLSVRSLSPEDTSDDGEGSVESTDNVLAEETSGIQTEEAEGLETGETSGLQPTPHERQMMIQRSRTTGQHHFLTSDGRAFKATPFGIAVLGNIFDSTGTH